MADSRDQAGSSGSALLVSGLAGALVGAAGLAWWLLAGAERRRSSLREQRLLQLSRLQGGAQDFDHRGQARAPASLPGPALNSEAQLHDRVQQLNEAIDEVRRQLEQLQPQP